MKKVEIKSAGDSESWVEALKGKPTYIDSHIHLADEAYQSRVGEILAEAREVGVEMVIACSEDFETALETLQLAWEHPFRVLPALGVHPWNPCEEEALKVSSLISRHYGMLAAVGEVGLDRAYAGKKSEVWRSQLKVFRLMLEAAEKAGLPVIAHSRQSGVEVLEEASSFKVKVVFHWFSGEINLLRRVLDRGFYITVGPSLHYSKHIQRVALEAPLSRIMVETDGPVRYKGPFQGAETKPSLIPRVVAKLAEVKGVSLEEAASQILENCMEVFNGVEEALRRLKGEADPVFS